MNSLRLWDEWEVKAREREPTSLAKLGHAAEPSCYCQWRGLSFEHMFESTQLPAAPAPSGPRVPPVLAPEGEPVEFIYQGRRFHIHAIASRWRESGGWWNRIDDGRVHPKPLEETIFDDGARAIWRVEAAPVGALATFELELDEITGSWQIRPTSRPR
jgi:Family of unknown function (DUF6504)